MIFSSPIINSGGLYEIALAEYLVKPLKRRRVRLARRCLTGRGNSKSREYGMFDDIEIEIATVRVKREGGSLFRIYSRDLCIALCGLIRGEDGKKNSLLKILSKNIHTQVPDIHMH